MPQRLRFPLVLTAMLLLFAATVVTTLLLVTHGSARATVGDRTVKLTAAEQRGREVFGRTCGGCHSLHGSDTHGVVGPDLDLIKPTASQVTAVIASGSSGFRASMPAGLLGSPQADDVAAYVAKVADREQFYGYKAG
jgi:mono/diheme cytochrome c family protein